MILFFKETEIGTSGENNVIEQRDFKQVFGLSKLCAEPKIPTF